MIRDLRSEVVQLDALAVLPTFTGDLEAKTGSQQTEVQSPRRDLQSTQDSLNRWYEVNLNSIQGIYVDESVLTSTSTVSRITEPAISHPLQAGTDPGLFLRREHTIPKAASKLTAAPSTPQARISQTPVQYTVLLF